MSLKDLLPPGTYDEIEKEAHVSDSGSSAAAASIHTETNVHADCGAGADSGAADGCDVLMVSCPTCKKKIKYSTDNPFRPFCSERCKLLDLGAWADEKHSVPGKDVNEDEDADLLSDPDLPVRNLPNQDN